MQVFIGLTTDLTDLTDEKGEWVGEMGAHTERIFGRTDGTDGTTMTRTKRKFIMNI